MTTEAVSQRVSVEKWTGAGSHHTERHLAEETAIAIVYNGTTHAVMMATPNDLQDFALGFALTEGLIENTEQCERFELVEHPHGLEARLWLERARADLLTARRRQMAGPIGCGLCGVESLEQAMRDVVHTTSTACLRADSVTPILAELHGLQVLNHQTRAVHAAALWMDGAIRLVREDVGRHNALDKLIGAATRQGYSPAHGCLLLTSRVSIEMIQKAAVAGFGIVVAISAPTTKAVAVAHACGITLIGIARSNGYEVFTHPHRIVAP